jgi:hypothetical protein
MAILIEDVQMEHLAHQIAKAEGVSVNDVVKKGLLSLANLRGLLPRKQPLRERLTALAHELDALPASTDKRSDNEVLGYNESGSW